MSDSEFVLVPRASMDWLAHHFPTLILKAGFKDRIYDPPQKMIDDLDFGPEPPEEEQG